MQNNQDEGVLIELEGTDCSGKQTQTELLIKRLRSEGLAVEQFSFPMYETPTGRIVGGPYLGKEHICDGYFEEGAVNVDPKVASLYYAADRRYNAHLLTELMNQGTNIILDRYIFSNMAHQGGKIFNAEERMAMYKWLETLEYDLLELPKPDKVIFLYMPYQYALELKKNREEKPDQHEADAEHLIAAERTYLELANLYNFETVECFNTGVVRPIEAIHEEVYGLVRTRMRR